MSDFSNENWETIKTLAARLQAIRNLLEIFGNQIDNQPFADELRPVKRELEEDFQKTLDSLLKLIDDNHVNDVN